MYSHTKTTKPGRRHTHRVSSGGKTRRHIRWYIINRLTVTCVNTGKVYNRQGKR